MLHIKYKQPKRIIILALALVMMLSGSVVYFNSSYVRAESTDELRTRAKDLEAQISAQNAQAAALAAEADTLKSKIGGLDIEIASVSTQIELTNVRLQQLDADLQKAQQELDRQKALLKASVRAIYKKGDASTVELLIGSDNFTQFFNDQTYLEKLKSGIQESTEKVIALKQQIQTQQAEQKDLLAQQKVQKDSLASAKAEKEQILQQTQGEEARYRAVSADLQKQQAALLAEIVARSRVITNVGTGSYEWASYREGNWTHGGSCNYGDDIDPWGYCYRQCVSYVAWKLYSTGKNPPVRYGNAADWMWRTPQSQRGSQPRVGAVAVWGGYEGHVAYVEEVMSNGQIRVSEYNAVPAFQGRYSQRVMSANDPDMFLYF